MKNRRTILMLLMAVTSIAVVGLVFVQVGNIAIRRIRPSSDIMLEVSEPVVLGVKTPVHWTRPAAAADQTVELRLRTVSGEQTLTLAQLSDRVAHVSFPCSLDTVNASVSLVDVQTGSLITWKNITLLPPGQDCF